MYLVYKRPKLWPFLLVGVLSFSAGMLVGDVTADKRFAEREASIRAGIQQARAQADRIAESIRQGCFKYVMSKREP